MEDLAELEFIFSVQQADSGNQNEDSVFNRTWVNIVIVDSVFDLTSK